MSNSGKSILFYISLTELQKGLTSHNSMTKKALLHLIQISLAQSTKSNYFFNQLIAKLGVISKRLQIKVALSQGYRSLALVNFASNA